MTPISQRFAIPTKSEDFEALCRDLLRRHWSRPGLEIFKKRGERQYGVDILDLKGENPIFAAQCKLKEPHKSLSPKELQDEIDEAKKFRPALGKYGILTTGKVSGTSQIKIREINQTHKESGLFEVELFTWERICLLLQQYSDVQEEFYGEIASGRARQIEESILVIKDGVQSLTSAAAGSAIDSEINEARDLIAKREFQLATLLLNRLRAAHDTNLSERQRFRIFSNLGAAALGEARTTIAAQHFFAAVQWQPEDEQAKTNEALAHALIGDTASCHSMTSRLRLEYPRSFRLAALWLNSAPKELPFKTLEAEINAVLRADA